MTPQELVRDIYANGSYQRAVRLALRFTGGDWDAAEDLVQETAIKVYRQPPERNVSRAYWSVALRSAAATAGRRQQRARSLVDYFADEHVDGLVAGDDVEARAIGLELADTLAALIVTTLTRGQRRALARRMAGEPHPSSSSKVLLYHGRRRLRAALAEAAI